MKVLVLTTGGTISSRPSTFGLKSTDNSDIFNFISNIKTDGDFTVKDIMLKDSSNMQPEDWILIVERISNYIEDFDGIIITHGTDTLAYTSSMISFLIQNPKIPIVFTGSQLPLSHELTDAIDNFKAAISMIKSKTNGIFVAFDRKIILGTRAVKVRTRNFNAFASINVSPVGLINASGLQINKTLVSKFSFDSPMIIHKKLDPNVFLLKVTPGLNPNLLDLLVEAGIKGFVIEAYGSGGVSFIDRDLVSKIKELINKNIPVVLCSQCLYEVSDFTIYETGQKVLEENAIEARDMTSEACVTKLMWALSISNNLREVKKMFETNIAGEITL
ncbi:MAG: asparaginase [Anaeroplasmataceae bacterium]